MTMNAQSPDSKSHIEWTRILLPDGTRSTGWTWNPIGGCQHECRWTMPDGVVAECYAETAADRMTSAYPDGFAAHYWRPHLLNDPIKLKTPAGIFCGSMADNFGSWVPKEQTEQVLDVCRRANWHTFMMLTKNAPRLLQFEFPANVWVGVSSPPDFMFGKPLTRNQQERMIRRTMTVLKQLKDENRACVLWMSIEPLSWDISAILAEFPGVLDWAVIGAASNGNKKYPIDHNVFMRVQAELDKQGIPTFYKGNLRTNAYAAANWREDFPTHRAPHEPVPSPSGTPVPRIEVVDPAPTKPADSSADTFAPIIPALSIWQIWASLIALGLKRIETRAFPVTYRGDIVIHASKRWTREEQDAAALLMHRFPEIAAHAVALNNPPLGCALAVARLVDCVPSEKLRGTISPLERACGGYTDGRYGLVLEDVRVFPEPIPMIGQQTTRALGWRIPHPLYHIEMPKRDAAIVVTTKRVPLTKFQVVRNLFDPETQTWSGDHVYIGRAMPSYRLPDSIWANPFKLDKDTPEARRAAIEQYRTHITGKIATEPERYDLNTLRDKTLVCWCTPDGSRGEYDETLCHGHVLMELVESQSISVKPLPHAPPTKDEIAALYQPFDAREYQEHVTADTLAIDRAHHLIAEHYQRDRNTPEWQTELERLRRLRDAVIAWSRTKAAAPKPKQHPEGKLREELTKVRHGIEVLSPHADPPPGSKLRRSQLAAEMLGGKRKEESRLMAELEKLAKADAKVLA